MNSASSLEAIRASRPWRVLEARGSSLAAYALAIILAIQVGFIVTNLAGAGAPAAATGGVQARQSHTLDVAAILDNHLFGLAPAGTAALDPNAPRTDLPLVLTGVIAARDPHDGFGILGPSAAQAMVYAVGDTVPGGARLAAVLPHQVLLDRDGRQESLALPRQQSLPLPAAAAPADSAPAFVQHMRELVARRPNVMSELLRPEPVFAGGRQLGFRVYPGTRPQAFAALGFRPGDLVTAIDGTPLDDPAQDQQILNTLGSSSEASVTVLRNGRPRVLNLNLAQVEQMARQLSAAPTEPATPPGPPSPPTSR